MIQTPATAPKKSLLKKLLLAGIILLLAGGAAVWYIFTREFEDTATQEAAYTVSAMPFMEEFRNNIDEANKKYSEKIITVNGRVTEIEKADTAVNIKMADTGTGDYIIFAFQQQHIKAAKQVQVGDSIAIKGSCSAGVYSDILETGFITFKRCSINK
ncbi:MAG TPA: hypothetical protein PKC39_13030 [Ferruginibacter sp.]|nr:hypothetical protein [Ferruginibacter sp.]HMP21876.1 hypothetical protein [Ferruginibacter sp.]